MTTYYKATAPTGRDFRTGTIDYAGALTSGQQVWHPSSACMVPNRPSTYLSISTAPAETLIGGKWPCRLFVVDPVGDLLDGLSASEYKRACLSVRVVAELPAWQALGPNGQRVAALVRRASSLTGDEAPRLDAARRVATGVAARAVAGNAAVYAARAAARVATEVAVRATARVAAGDAALALLTEDLITPEQFAVLAGPWMNVIGLPEIVAAGGAS